MHAHCVYFWIRCDFDEFDTWAVRHIAAKWNRGQRFRANSCNGGEVRIPCKIGLDVWKHIAPAVLSIVIDHLIRTFNDIAGSD